MLISFYYGHKILHTIQEIPLIFSLKRPQMDSWKTQYLDNDKKTQ